MRGFLGFTRRNLLIFFKDKQAVVFSLLTSIIVFVMYLLFLKGTFTGALNSAISEHEGLSMLITEADVDMLANLFRLTGILGSAMITVPYSCLTTVIRDRESNIDYDILATPLRRGQIILSYFISAAISSIIMNGIILSAGLVITGFSGKLYIGARGLLAAYGTVALGSVSATALFMILVLCFKSSSASGAFFGILSAASGFVIGAYIPISQFSEGIQTACNIFPASQVTTLLRNALMNGVLEHMDASIGGLDNGMFVSAVKELFSFRANMFGFSPAAGESIIYILIVLAISIAVQIILFSKTYKKN